MFCSDHPFKILLMDAAATPDSITKKRPSNCTHVLLWFWKAESVVLDFWHTYKMSSSMAIVELPNNPEAVFCPALGMCGSVWKQGNLKLS